MMLKTNISDQIRRSANEESVSVIHAPESFRDWVSLLVMSVLWGLAPRLTLIGFDRIDRGTGAAKREELSERVQCHCHSRRAGGG